MIFFFFWFCRFGYQWGRKKGNPKEARRIIAERKHRRLEKKENWKTQKKQGKDKVCAFHFYFILWTWWWGVLGLHNVNAPISLSLFFFLASACPVRPSYCIFCVERILGSKNNSFRPVFKTINRIEIRNISNTQIQALPQKKAITGTWHPNTQTEPNGKNWGKKKI